MDASARRALVAVAHRAQPVERAGKRELGCTEPVDEVAAPDPTRLLERAEDRVDAGEPALDPSADDRLAGQHAVPLEQGRAPGRGVARSGRRASTGSTSDQRPAASGGPSAVRRPGRPRRAPAPEPDGRFQRSARSGANVSLVTSPAQTRSHSASSISRSEPPPAAAWIAR